MRRRKSSEQLRPLEAGSIVGCIQSMGSRLGHCCFGEELLPALVVVFEKGRLCRAYLVLGSQVTVSVHCHVSLRALLPFPRARHAVSKQLDIPTLGRQNQRRREKRYLAAIERGLLDFQFVDHPDMEAGHRRSLYGYFAVEIDRRGREEKNTVAKEPGRDSC